MSLVVSRERSLYYSTGLQRHQNPGCCRQPPAVDCILISVVSRWTSALSHICLCMKVILLRMWTNDQQQQHPVNAPVYRPNISAWAWRYQELIKPTGVEQMSRPLIAACLHCVLLCVCMYESDKMNHMVCVRACVRKLNINPLLLFTISLCGLAAALLVWGRATGSRLGARQAWHAA